MKKLILLAVAVAAMSAASNQVYVSKTGKKYHTHKDCQYIKHSAEVSVLTIQQAKAKGLTLCSRCNSKDNNPKNK